MIWQLYDYKTSTWEAIEAPDLDGATAIAEARSEEDEIYWSYDPDGLGPNEQVGEVWNGEQLSDRHFRFHLFLAAGSVTSLGGNADANA